MKPINSQWQKVKFGKFAEKLTATQSVIHYLKCKMCSEKKTYIKKTIRDNTKEFKDRINQHFSDCKISTCKFPCHVYDYGIKNNCQEEFQ